MHVERAHQIILEDCLKPARRPHTSCPIPRYTGLHRNLERYLSAEVIGKATIWSKIAVACLTNSGSGQLKEAPKGH